MKIGTKLTLGFATVSAMTVIVIALSMNLSGHIEKLRFIELPMERHIREVEVSLWASLAAVDNYRHRADPSLIQDLEDQEKNLEEHFRQYCALTDTQEERQLTDAFDEQWAKVKRHSWQILSLTSRKKRVEGKFFELVDKADDVLDFEVQEHLADDDPNALAKERSVREVELVLKQLRETDTLCRMGGDEFVVLLEDTDIDVAHVIAERVRMAAGDLKMEQGVQASLSIGMVGIDGSLDVEGLLRQADDCMYQAKSSGRDRVCCA